MVVRTHFVDHRCRRSIADENGRVRQLRMIVVAMMMLDVCLLLLLLLLLLAIVVAELFV